MISVDFEISRYSALDYGVDAALRAVVQSYQKWDLTNLELSVEGEVEF
jgi:hypothetical protein